MSHFPIIKMTQDNFRELSPEKSILVLHPQFQRHNLLIDALLDVSKLDALYINLPQQSATVHDLWGALQSELNSLYQITLPPLVHPQNAASQLCEAVKLALPLIVILTNYDGANAEVHRFVVEASQMLVGRLRFLISGRRWPNDLIAAVDLPDNISVLPVAPQYLLLDYLNHDPQRKLLEVRSLGFGQVLINGRHIEQWDGVLPRSLFFYFVDRGMTTRDEVFDTFWPELSTREATNVFHVTKRKISEILGLDLTVYSSGFYRISPDIDLHYDVVQFVEAVQEAAVVDSVAARRYLERALLIYHRDFLGDFDQSWAIRRREELKMVQVDALSALARLHEQGGRIEEAVGLYSRAFGIFPQREDLARTLMQYYLRKEHPERSMKVYTRLKQELSKALGVEPSIETRALANEVQDRVDE